MDKFKHSLKIALRNLRKYPSQSLVSIVGLAVGFTSFALSVLWIHYEMTYDSFHEKAEQIYILVKTDPGKENKYTTVMPDPMGDYLKQLYPEIESTCHIYPSSKVSVETPEDVHSLSLAGVDSAFITMFDVQLLAGSLNFLIPNSKQIAVTVEAAKLLFGEKDPLGQVVKINGNEEQTVCAVVNSWNEHTNFPYQLLHATEREPRWNYSIHNYTLLHLHPASDIELLKQKLSELEVSRDLGGGASVTYRSFGLIPLKELHYNNPMVPGKLKFRHLLLFTFASVLVILASLFNYLTLFVSRFRIREKEIALRLVCGASWRSLFSLFSTEFLITLLFALSGGWILTSLLLPPFLSLSEIRMSLSSVFLELTGYILLVILLSVLVFLLVLILFRRRSLNASIRRSNRHLFRKAAILFQLVVSIGFIFCTVVMLKQIYFLQHVDLGFSVSNRGYISAWNFSDTKVLADKIARLPEVEEAMPASEPLLPIVGYSSAIFSDWQDKASDSDRITCFSYRVSPRYLKFYEIRLKEGEFLSEDDDVPDQVLLNEAAVRAFGWSDPVGKTFASYRVKGVIYDIFSHMPTIPVEPAYYQLIKKGADERSLDYVLFRYKEGMRYQLEAALDKLVQEEFPEVGSAFHVGDSQEVFEGYLQSEQLLIRLLSLITLVCVFVALFGFFSLVSLTCEERRREIAVRKVNGATAGDILGIFFREYLLLLLLGALIAFPISLFLMRRWMEQYTRQAEVGAWIYLLILFAMALVILISVGWRVYNTSRENPAQVLKSE